MLPESLAARLASLRIGQDRSAPSNPNTAPANASQLEEITRDVSSAVGISNLTSSDKEESGTASPIVSSSSPSQPAVSTCGRQQQKADMLTSRQPSSANSLATDTSSASSQDSTPSPNTTPADPDVIILVTSDNVSHVTSKALLCAHSPFFSGMLSLPTPDTKSTGGTDVIPLPSATSAGLALILRLLKAFGISPAGARPEFRYLLGITVDDLNDIAEAAICADAYDTPIFHTAFVDPVLARLAEQPGLGFVIAANTGADDQIFNFARKLLDSGLSAEFQELLQQRAPDHLTRLAHLRRRYADATRLLKKELRHAEPTFNGFENYARRCKGDKEGYQPCPAFYRERIWHKRRQAAAEVVFEHFVSQRDTDPASTGDHNSIRAALQKEVRCTRCTGRLASTFIRPLKRFWSSDFSY